MTAEPGRGEVALVLHTHLPYVRDHGTWPVGEEWLFQAWGESWLPVTDVLLRLAEQGHRTRSVLAAVTAGGDARGVGCDHRGGPGGQPLPRAGYLRDEADIDGVERSPP